MMRGSTLLGAFVAPLALIACATAVMPSDNGVVGGPVDGGLASGDGGYGGGGDTGTSTIADSGTVNDAGTTTNPDTGTPVVDSGTPVVDSGGGALHGGDCTRTTSTQFTPAETYDTVCDNHYSDPFGNPAPCATGGTGSLSCARFAGQGGFTKFCCFHPAAGSNCDFDYFGQPQCVPE